MKKDYASYEQNCPTPSWPISKKNPIFKMTKTREMQICKSDYLLREEIKS